MHLISVKKSVNHPVVQQWCQNSSYMRVMWIWITDNFKWNTSHSNHLVGPALIIRKPFLELPFFSAAEETIFLLRCPSLPCLVWRVKTICCSQLPRHYKGSHAYSKVWRTNKTITLLLQSSAPSTFIVMSNFHRFKVLHKWWRWLRDSYLQTMPT